MFGIRCCDLFGATIQACASIWEPCSKCAQNEVRIEEQNMKAMLKRIKADANSRSTTLAKQVSSADVVNATTQV